jgi:O-antigen ligase
MFFLLGYATMLFLSCFKYFDYSFPLFFEQAIKFLILYFIITHLVKDKNQYIGIVWAIIILAAIASTFGLYQHIFNIGRHYFEGRVRITGTETDPNFFGIQQVLAVPLILSLFYTYKNKAVKIFLLSIFFLVLYTIVFTYSRTAMLALGAVLFLSFLRPIFFKRRNFTPLIIMILIFLVLIPFVPTEYWQRAKSITNLEDAAIRSRIGAWRLGLNMVRQNPFRGVGFGVFQYEYLKEAIIAPDVSGIYQTAMFAHNSFIELAAEAGLIAFVFFSLIIFSAFKYLKKAQKAFYEKGDFLMLHTTMGLEVSLVAFLIGAFFLSNLWVLSIWIIIPLSVVLKKLTGKEKAQ